MSAAEIVARAVKIKAECIAQGIVSEVQIAAVIQCDFLDNVDASIRQVAAELDYIGQHMPRGES